MTKIYIEAPKGVLDPDTLTKTMQVILRFTDDARLDHDEHGTFIEVPDAAYEAMKVDSAEEAEEEKPAPRKRGRPRKVQE